MKEKQELLGIKLKQGIPFSIGKKGGIISTPSPTWKFIGFDNSDLDFPMTTTTTSVSARKIGANLWEGQTHFNGGDGLRRRHHHPRHTHQDNSFEIPNKLDDYPPKQQVSPYNRAITPTVSLDFNQKIRGAKSDNLKSSTELLKVLNRIWSLEQQHASNTSMVKTLKRELDHSQVRIKELSQERKKDHLEMEELKRQLSLAECKVVKKSVQLKEELEVERKLRKHSESLHHKLAREHSETKSSLLNSMKEVEREKKARVLLENLCDEFAKGVRDYEEEVRSLKQRPEKGNLAQGENVHHPDKLIVHVSETWLDERVQMKLAEDRCDFSRKNTIFDNLAFEIETFLQAKQKQDDLLSKKHKEIRSHRRSLESFQLNEDIHEEDSVSSGSCFEFNQCSTGKVGCTQNNHLEGKTRSNSTKSKIRSSEAEANEIQQEGLQDNSLKAKLLEARLENQRSHSRRVKG